MSAAVADLRPSNRWLYPAMAVLLAASVSVQMLRDPGWTPYVPPSQAMWLRSPAVAKKVFLGYRNLAADVYWMRAVVYYGGQRRQNAEDQAAGVAPAATFELLYPLLDLVTTLDPDFRAAYRFGAIFLTEAYPAGPGRPDLAIALLQRGLEGDAARWEYMHDIGFVHYWWRKDFEKAAEWFRRAAKENGAPAWLEPLAATTLAQGGNRDASRFLWQQLSDSDVEWLRSNAHVRLQQLDAMDQIDELNRRVAQHVQSGKPVPKDWREFVTATRLRGVPLDPAGMPYVLDAGTGMVDIDRKSPLYPLPR